MVGLLINFGSKSLEVKGLFNNNLKVFDILGREIATLVNGIKQPGNYEVKFNGINYPSGIYIYKLTSMENSIVKKMLLLK